MIKQLNLNHMNLTIENPNINDVYDIFYSYNIKHKKNYKYYLMKCEFNLVFKNNEHCPYVTSDLYGSETMCSWYIFSENVFNDFRDGGYNFNPIAEMKIITITNKLYLSYDFYNKHNMHAVEWRLNAVINKSKNLIIKLDRNKRHSFIRK